MRDFYTFGDLYNKIKMPQINVFTYLSQTTWTLLIFVLYYINMKQIIIPSLLEIIKLKKNSILILSSPKVIIADNNLNNNSIHSNYINI